MGSYAGESLSYRTIPTSNKVTVSLSGSWTIRCTIPLGTSVNASNIVALIADFYLMYNGEAWLSYIKPSGSIDPSQVYMKDTSSDTFYDGDQISLVSGGTVSSVAIDIDVSVTALPAGSYTLRYGYLVILE